MEGSKSIEELNEDQEGGKFRHIDGKSVRHGKIQMVRPTLNDDVLRNVPGRNVTPLSRNCRRNR